MRTKNTQIEKICPVCGTGYWIARSDEARGYRQRCSRECYAKSRTGTQRTPRITKTCKQCGQNFSIRPVELSYGRGGYCCKHCFDEAQRGDPYGRLWNRVDKSDGPGACWPWTGKSKVRGYPVMRFNGKQRRVARIILELDGRPAGTNQLACHTCDNPPCCNPAHLYPGSPADNVDDRQKRERFRWAVGEERRNTKLTTTQVLEIRSAHQSGESYESLARRFGVTSGNIRWIVKKKSWKHV